MHIACIVLVLVGDLNSEDSDLIVEIVYFLMIILKNI